MSQRQRSQAHDIIGEGDTDKDIKAYYTEKSRIGLPDNPYWDNVPETPEMRRNRLADMASRHSGESNPRAEPNSGLVNDEVTRDTRAARSYWSKEKQKNFPGNPYLTGKPETPDLKSVRLADMEHKNLQKLLSESHGDTKGKQSKLRKKVKEVRTMKVQMDTHQIGLLITLKMILANQVNQVILVTPANCAHPKRKC